MLGGAILLVIMLQASNTQDPQQKADRDLTRYETIGPYLVDADLGKAERDAIHGRIRDFLWRSYVTRKLAHVTVRHINIEGEQSIASYFVESDAEAHWRIHGEVLRVELDRRIPKKTIRTETTFDAYQLLRVVVTMQEKKERIALETEVLSANQYELRLLDKTGRKLTQI